MAGLINKLYLYNCMANEIIMKAWAKKHEDLINWIQTMCLIGIILTLIWMFFATVKIYG